MMELKKSNVVFNEVEHTYLLGDKTLSGITSVLSKYLFPDKYKYIPESILKTAAEHGSLVHSQMQMWIIGMPFDTQEECVTKMQAKLLGRNFIESEFTVSDNEHFASQIDAIEETADGVILWDWKTTSRLDREYLSWQLSIYAYLFELQTGVRVLALAAGHVKGDTSIIDISRKDNELVKALLECAARGDEKFDLVPAKVNGECNSLLEELSNIEPFIVELEAKLKEMKTIEDKLKSALIGAMEKNDVKKMDTEYLTVAYKEPYTRASIDTAKLKADKPDIYEMYKKESKVKASLTLTIK